MTELRRALRLALRAVNNLREAARIEACAADERAIDIWLRHERTGVVRLDTAAVLNPNFAGRGFVGNFSERQADERVCFLRLFRRRGVAGPDGPHRCVVNHCSM